MSDYRIFHLWLDCETTGLVPQVDNVLEIAWTITDTDLRMVTPLRSRLARLAPELDSERVNRHMFHPLLERGTRSNTFDPETDAALLSDVVREMHETSGLLRDLSEAEYGRARKLMIREPRDFERLLLEDLALIDFDEDAGDRLVISGAGVSHFDVYVLAEHWPELFPLIPGSADVAAYWQHDTSVAWRVLGKDVENEIRARAPRLYDTVPGDEHWSPFWSLFTAETSVDANVSHLLHVRPDGWGVFMRDRLRPHRAADDVVASLLDARMLRRAREILALPLPEREGDHR